ncbi:hypothetical protein J6590_020165 [Homalodisca vitripennis]|nr:hypothetical protein J6590_020165 [Homalodisca vitripennis]
MGAGTLLAHTSTATAGDTLRSFIYNPSKTEKCTQIYRYTRSSKRHPSYALTHYVRTIAELVAYRSTNYGNSRTPRAYQDTDDAIPIVMVEETRKHE